MKPDAILKRASLRGLAPLPELLWMVNNDAYGDGNISVEGIHAARLARKFLRLGVVLDPWEAIDRAIAVQIRTDRDDDLARRASDAAEFARAAAYEAERAKRGWDDGGEIPF